MLCSSCSRSFDNTARYCSCCGQPLYAQMPYPATPLMRAQFGKMIAGVCAGFAHSYRLDVTVVRIVVCLLAVMSVGTVFIAYLVAWIVMPEAPYLMPQPVNPGVPAS